MKAPWILAICLLASGVASAEVYQPLHEKLKTQPCPKSLVEWNKLVADIVGGAVPSDTDPRSLPYAEMREGLIAGMNRCEKEWSSARKEDEQKLVSACTARVKRFLSRVGDFKESTLESFVNKIHGQLPDVLRKLVTKRSHSLGFNATDQEYYRQVDSYVNIPDELHDAEFLKNISNPWQQDGLKKARAYLERLNEGRAKIKLEPIVHFYFETKLGNFESSQKKDAGRLFVRFPGNPVKYIQFATHDRQGGSGQTSVVAVYSDKKGTLHTYIKDHFRDIQDNGEVKLKKVEDGIFKGNACINCHQSGPRALSPRNWDKLDEATKEQIKKINREFAGMTGMEWGGFYDSASMDFGPPLGEDGDKAEKRRSPDFFDSCTNKELELAEKYPREGVSADEVRKNKEKVYAKLKSAMNCASCHNGVERGPIKIPFDYAHTFGKVFSGQMPPRNKLSEFEAVLLNSCLKAEFFGYYNYALKKDVPGTVQAYLNGIQCEGSASGEPRDSGKKGSSPPSH